MSPVVWMSPAVTDAGAALLKHEALDAVARILIRDVLDVEHDVDDVLAHARIEENSCSTPSIWTEVIAAP